jgi:hypothetical protein
MNQVNKDDICLGCGHSLGQHIQSVNGKVYCWHTYSHTSTGVIMTYNVRCDCINYISETCTNKQKEKEQEDKEMQERIDIYLSNRKDK